MGTPSGRAGVSLGDQACPPRHRARWSVHRGLGASSETPGTLECLSGTRRPHSDTGRAGASHGDQACPPRHGARWSVSWGPGAPTQTRGSLVSRGVQALSETLPLLGEILSESGKRTYSPREGFPEEPSQPALHRRGEQREGAAGSISRSCRELPG